VKRVFLDSGVFIALLNAKDQWHSQAVMLFDSDKVKWYTSVLVVSETYSWFLHRYGEESARTFRMFLAQLDGLEIFGVDPDDLRSVFQVQDQMRGSKLTFVDAHSLNLLGVHKIKIVWATDHHLALTGAQVLPLR
jgi:predicted nucleic acid-binding protein